MATTISKLFPTGILQTGVTLDEVTYSFIKVGTNGVFASEFDEVNLTGTVAERKTNTGKYQVSGYFDEYTLVPNSNGIVTSGLMVNLDTAPTSGTTWLDTSGNGRNATLQGSASYVSGSGGGIKLNNSTNTGTGYISVPYNISSNTVTVEVIASFNPTGLWATIWGNESYTAGRGYLAFMTSSTGITYGKSTAPTVESITASNSIRHWTFVINGTQHSLYLNGTQVGTTDTLAVQTLFVTSEFYFGSRHANAGTGTADKMNNSNSALQPVFYQMRIYNTALSGSQVTQNYNAVKSTYGI